MPNPEPTAVAVPAPPPVPRPGGPPLYGVWLVATECGGSGPGCIGDEWLGVDGCAVPPDAWVPNPLNAQIKKCRDDVDPVPLAHPEHIALWFSRSRAAAERKAFEPERRVLDGDGKDLAEQVRLYDGSREGLHVLNSKGVYVPAERTAQ